MSTSSRNLPVTEEYRAQLTLNNTRVSITGQRKEEVLSQIRKLMDNRVQFDDHDDSIFVNRSNDQAPIGWVSRYEVPEQLSINHTIESTLKKVA